MFAVSGTVFFLRVKVFAEFGSRVEVFRDVNSKISFSVYQGSFTKVEQKHTSHKIKACYAHGSDNRILVRIWWLGSYYRNLALPL